MTGSVHFNYQLRGQRVVGLTARQIDAAATASVTMLKINKDTALDMDRFIEHLGDRFGIEVDVIDDSEWMQITNAICDPSKLAIAMPNRLYVEICDGKPEALFIFFHELGHLLLAHKPVLHFSDSAATQLEDAEWQADRFSDQVLRIMGVRRKPKQLPLWPE